MTVKPSCYTSTRARDKEQKVARVRLRLLIRLECLPNLGTGYLGTLLLPFQDTILGTGDKHHRHHIVDGIVKHVRKMRSGN